MALPVQQSPMYSVIIPSSNTEMKFRPFVVKEQKALMLAQQSEDAEVMADTLKTIIKDCIKGELDVETLAIFDLEYIFSQIRAKSVGEEVDISFRCGYCEDEKAKVKITIDLTKLEVERNPEHTNKFELFDDVGVVMKYPSMKTLEAIQTNSDDIDAMFKIMASCVDYIYDSDEIHHGHETSEEELIQFIENLTQDQFAKINSFFETMPSLTKHIEFNCPACGEKNTTILKGIDDFFS